jgi:hypothetical protein
MNTFAPLTGIYGNVRGSGGWQLFEQYIGIITDNETN